MAAATLSELPDELVLDIISRCSHANLLCLARVNKRMYEIASSILYAHVHFRWNFKKSESPRNAHFERDYKKLESTGPPHAISLLGAFLRKPHLGLHVQRLELLGGGFDYRYPYSFILNHDKEKLKSLSYEELRPPPLWWDGAEETLRSAISLVAEFDLPYLELWVEKLREGTMDAIVALMLVRLPNLRSLIVQRDFTKEQTCVMAVLRTVALEKLDWLPRFIHLREISMRFDMDDWICRNANSQLLLPLFYLPAIEALDLDLDDPMQWSWPTPAPPDAASIKSLTLRNVREHGLKFILATTKNLEKLEWMASHSQVSIINQASDATTSKMMDLDVVTGALLPLRNTLVDLSLGLNTVHPFGEDFFYLDFHGSLTGIAQLEKVERFQVELVYLASNALFDNRFPIWERVPRNLRILVFWPPPLIFPVADDQEEELGTSILFRNMREWMHKWRGETPRLERIEVLTFAGDAWSWGRQFFRDLFAEDATAGIEMVYSCEEIWGGTSPVEHPPYDETGW
ncbi:hypothetical protein MCOR27_009394 [Pyricularia oryzae]|uniref:F-box domain-containing protein n=2 Tax=Pyricularia TaxID=48558 RepID=A0ABQ8N5J8_PYRGI|nr:hypothetical protein MCOR01_010411 [Pyricularia oryzae]KAI6291653.1 hypothetical protein MCOR33_010452 [Pyricularia grisea]KAH9438607.1 hypothetical protein MCOR02_002222 [Pyricularia oryzae]KAI6257680.1 hypothetical protein MCOR19_005899 [Pyricularia oryzae]KAI6270211.1 hypothetical protein MCOR27_009394 [Pyricularia oryzae]